MAFTFRPVSRLLHLKTQTENRVVKLATVTNAGGSITFTMPPPGGIVAPPGWCGTAGLVPLAKP